MIAGCSVGGGMGNFMAVAVVVALPGGAESVGGPSLVDFANHHPIPLLHVLLHFCKWGNVVPMSIFLSPVWALPWHWRLLQFGLFFCFDGGGRCGNCRGIGQSLLVLNRFSEADPALGQGVPCLTGAMGMSSSGGGLILSFRDLVVGCGTSADCPIANLCTVTSIDSDVDHTISVSVLTVATVQLGAVEVYAG